jgi:hypothetical protein
MKYFSLPIILITIASCGGGGGGGSDSYSPQGSGGTPQPTNTAPTINNASNSFSVLENQTSAFSVEASDPEGDALTYSLSGDDASLFLITSSGTVRFVSAPDFENPQASAGGNAYSLTVSVSDGALTGSKDFTVTVTNDTSDDGPAGPEILGTRVIDGYISGANVFVDFNWNLVQDEGEPSATENEQDETYSFEAADFSSINNFTEECARARPRIASIPVGAVDADRGVVDAAYELYFFPWYGNVAEGTSSANITPLTSLFTSYLSDLLTTTIEGGFETGVNISVADGCSAEANSIGTEIESRVSEVMNVLENTFDIDPATFYDDFIASDNEKLQNFGEVVANYLQLTYGVSLLLEQEYGDKINAQLGQMLLENLLADTIPEVFQFALFNDGPTGTLDDNWIQYTQYAIYDVYGNQDGELLTGTDIDDISYELTLENLIEYTDFVVREVTLNPNWGEPLFNDDQMVLLESGTNKVWGEYRIIDIGTFQSDDQLIRYHESDNNSTEPPSKKHMVDSFLGGLDELDPGEAKLEVHLMNPANPERANLDEIFSERNTQSFIDIFDGVNGLAKTVDTLSENDNLLMDGDFQILSIEGWQYRRSNVNGLIEEFCTDMTNNIVYNEAEAYQECSENMPMENVAPPGGGEAPGGNSVTIEVSVEANNNGAGNVYVIDGTQKNTLNFVHGTTYTLNHPNGHPLRFSTTADGTHGGGVEYTDQVNTATDGSTVIEVTAGTPAILYYYCSIHPGMGGSINVTEN